MSNQNQLRLAIVLPNARIHKIGIGSLQRSFREAPLTATTLAALVPDCLNAKIALIDESVEPIPYGCHFDLVAISCMTGTAIEAYAIADRFRALGTIVVLGGVHVTLLPEEAQDHADAIVIGFAERSWPRLLKDFAAGQMNPVYKDKVEDLKGIPAPRRDLQKRHRYNIPDTVFATRGCKGACDFCSVPAARFGWMKRPVGDVLGEIRSIKAKRFVFNDVHLTEEGPYIKELLSGMVGLRKQWGGLASVRTLQDPELLDMLYKSGCIYLLIGFESFGDAALRSMKKHGSLKEYFEVVRNLHERGIAVQGCFIFGLDADDSGVFPETVELVNELKIDIPRYAIYTPFPGTAAFKRLDSECRILHYNWHYYDTQHTVFLPALMTPQELEEGFKTAYRETFRFGSIIRRVGEIKGNRLIPFLGNVAYRLYIRRLYKEKLRFPVNSELARELTQKEMVLP